ncbi:Copia protein, partial [Mucuna pruriens]
CLRYTNEANLDDDKKEDVKGKVHIRSIFKIQGQVSFTFEIKPKNVGEALLDDGWVEAMKEKFVIGTKWMFKDKHDENGKIIRNKARLVAQGFSQPEGINYTKTFALVVRLEVIRILLSFVAHSNMGLYQMDVKSVFLNGIINEEVYVKQPPGFISDAFQTIFLNSKRLSMI